MLRQDLQLMYGELTELRATCASKKLVKEHKKALDLCETVLTKAESFGKRLFLHDYPVQNLSKLCMDFPDREVRRQYVNEPRDLEITGWHSNLPGYKRTLTELKNQLNNNNTLG